MELLSNTLGNMIFRCSELIYSLDKGSVEEKLAEQSLDISAK